MPRLGRKVRFTSNSIPISAAQGIDAEGHELASPWIFDMFALQEQPVFCRQACIWQLGAARHNPEALVTNDHRFDEEITITLRRDEAIVLFVYLSRELYMVADEKNLRASFVHAAEVHGLLALHQELFPPLMDIGAPGAEGIESAAREHLLKRHT